MSRVAPIDPDKLAPADRAIWDRIAAMRSGAAVRGPSAILMNRPDLAGRVATLEDYFRTEAELPAVDRELVILATVRELEARFAWARHEARGKEVGTRGAAIETLRAHNGLDGLTARERVLVEVVQTLLRSHTLSDDLYARALAELGQTQLIEVVALAGQYCIISLVINAFAIPEDTQTF